MALTPRLGSLTSQSSPNAIPNEIPNTQTGAVSQAPYVADANLNKFAIDTSQYPETTKMLVGFMKGKRVSVTYYRQLHREGGSNRTNIADNVTQRGSLNTEYQKIINLEITLSKEFDFSANQQQASVQISGQAFFYPNMNPYIGDRFLMGLGDGKIGICVVSDVKPMSWRTDRIYAVEFTVTDFANSMTQDPVEGSVSLISVFSKENYLGGTAALLSEQTYVQLQTIKPLRSNLCKYYHQQFFDNDLCSYVRPDGVYDPWVVRFMSSKVTLDDVPMRPKNLLGQQRDLYLQTLWSRLEDRFNTTLYGILPHVKIQGYYGNTMNVFVTELCGRQMLLPVAQSDSTYLYSQAFYSGVITTMTTEELLVYKIVTERNVGDLTALMTNYLDTVFLLSTTVQFYKIPLYIHMIDMALQSQYREIDAPSMSYASQPGS